MQEISPKSYTFIPNDLAKEYDESSSLTFTHPDYYGGKCLESVEFEGVKVNFTYSHNTGKKFFKNISATVRGEIVYSADLSYTNCLPTEVRTPEGNYTFEYDQKTINEGSGRDWWGFPNGQKAINGSHCPSVSFRKGFISTRDVNFIGANREIDEEYMQARILKRATFPTGGIVEWEYETHSFPAVEPIFSDSRDLLNAKSLSKGGGVRVKSVNLYNGALDTAPKVISYRYGKDGDGLANCRYAPTLDTFIGLRDIVGLYSTSEHEDDHTILYFMTKRTVTVNPESSYMANTFGEASIWYSQVEEIFPEGKIVYKYTDLLEPGQIVEAIPFSSFPEEITHAFSNGPQL
ncbi:MAG: hypothetical protein K2F79_05140, partial [Muribaculaceae bacterium]|nr:hypothetical protein [Muribaculaceae bacterium]